MMFKATYERGREPYYSMGSATMTKKGGSLPEPLSCSRVSSVHF